MDDLRVDTRAGARVIEKPRRLAGVNLNRFGSVLNASSVAKFSVELIST